MKISIPARLALTAGCALLAGAAHAVILLPGGVVNLYGTTLAKQPKLLGTNLGVILHPFSFTIGKTTYSGAISDQVVYETATGTMDFYYRIIMNQEIQNPSLWVERTYYPGTDQGGVTTDVNYRTDGSGVFGPDQAARSKNGVAVDFYYNGVTIAPGYANSSYWTLISTNSKSYDTKGIIRLQFDGGPVISLTGCYEPS